MSEHLIAARAALADEIADAQARIDRANAALAVLGGVVQADPVPLVRPPADDVPQPPVVIPKRETQPATQRPAAQQTVDCPECGKSVKRTGIGTHRRMAHKVTTQPSSTPVIPGEMGTARKYHYAEVAQVARDAVNRGESGVQAVAERYEITIDNARVLLFNLRKKGFDAPTSGKFTTEPITRMPVNEQAVRDEAAGPSVGRAPWQPLVPKVEAPVVDNRVLAFSVDDARAAIEAVG